MTTTFLDTACKTAAALLAILKNRAMHDFAMPGAPLCAYSAFIADLDAAVALCETEIPSIDDCTAIESFLGDVANAVLDGVLFPEAPRYWRQALLDAIEIAGMACAEITGSLKGQEVVTGVVVH